MSIRYELLGYGFAAVAGLYIYPMAIWKAGIIFLCGYLAWKCWNVKE